MTPEDYHSEGIRVRPYGGQTIYLHATVDGIAIGKPSAEINISADDGTQIGPRMDAGTVHDLILALQRVERFMKKVTS